jgi:hydrogenase-4 component F
MILHTLLKAGLFQALIRAAQMRGDAAPGHYGFSHLRGMIASSPALGWLLGGSIFALAGLPPSGLFCTEFLIISQTVQRDPLFMPQAVVALLSGIAVAWQ